MKLSNILWVKNTQDWLIESIFSGALTTSWAIIGTESKDVR